VVVFYGKSEVATVTFDSRLKRRDLRSKNISKKGPRNCRSLGFARDDKGEDDGFIKSSRWTEAFFITLGVPQAP
jgi:hypothetical protein